MARSNKYTSLNFNHIYDNRKPTTSTNSSSPNKTVITNSCIRGNMLVLTRPSPKPISPPITTQPPVPISLRPFGSPSPSILPLPLSNNNNNSNNNNCNNNYNNNKFVPPHLRPGFNGKEERPEPEIKKQTRQNPNIGSTVVNRVEEGRPKSGGGYEVNRTRFTGSNRPVSSG